MASTLSDEYRNFSIQNILLQVQDIEIAEIFKNSSEDSLINQILGSAIIQISLVDIMKKLNLVPDHVIGFGTGEFVAAYSDNYLTLKQTVLGLFYLASMNTKKTNNRNLENLEKILPSRENSYNKWIPAHEEKLNNSCAKYFADNMIDATNGLDLMKAIPSDALTLTIGSPIFKFNNNFLHLVNTDSEDHVVDFFTSLGR